MLLTQKIQAFKKKTKKNDRTMTFVVHEINLAYSTVALSYLDNVNLL